MTANPVLNRTARKLRLRVPSSARSPAADGEQTGMKEAVATRCGMEG